jgi:ubiquinone biosynthesis UbiH/UbiF/VisC/COQ6 family hydroxylase
VTKTDIAIIGAGPAGLCMARALTGAGSRITLIERLPRAALEQPGFDGREIALTHHSVTLMKRLGLWRHLPPEEISLLRDARVFNGTSRRSMHLDHRDGGRDRLGYLIPNHLIRAAALAAVMDAPDVTLWGEAQVIAAQADARHAEIHLSDGRVLSARLMIAADSRFSEVRRMMGISTRMRDFGRSMLVCRMAHEIPHDHTAWEWFDHRQTLALLPLGREGDPRNRSSVVLTLPAARMDDLRSMDEEAFGRELERRFCGRLGRMRLDSERHVYPLVGTYPERFVGERFALVGDAAVGMHPVTAHGFNLGLRGVEALSREILHAPGAGGDPGHPALLARYDRAHRRTTLPLYLATCGIVGLFTDDRRPARVLRSAMLNAADACVPFKRLLAASLADEGQPVPRL